MNLTIKEIRLRNLQILLKESGLSKAAFAQKVGTSAAYISQILSSKTKRSVGSLIAKSMELAFNKPTGWMDNQHLDEQTPDKTVEKTGDKTIDEADVAANAEWYGTFETWDDDKTPLEPDDVVLPFLKEVEIAAGPGRTEVVEYHMQKLRFAKSTLKKAGVDQAHAYCITIVGNSMEPVLPNGATLGIDSSKISVTDGDIYALDHAGALRVKLIYKLPGGGLRLRSFNSHEWPDESYSGDAAKAIKVLGRVFWWSVLR